MRVKYAVTFEFEMTPPMTHRGVIAAGQVHTCVARAVKEANKALRPRNWSSMVCVLLERLDASTEEDIEPSGDEEAGEEMTPDGQGV